MTEEVRSNESGVVADGLARFIEATLNDPTNKEVRTISRTGGEKGVKPERFDLIPVAPLEELARLYGFGATKYEDHNWRRGYEWSKSFAAMMRHAWSWWRGEEIDPETGVSHMASVAFHAFALMEFAAGDRYNDFDDRYLDVE